MRTQLRGVREQFQQSNRSDPRPRHVAVVTTVQGPSPGCSYGPRLLVSAWGSASKVQGPALTRLPTPAGAELPSLALRIARLLSHRLAPLRSRCCQTPAAPQQASPASPSPCTPSGSLGRDACCQGADEAYREHRLCGRRRLRSFCRYRQKFIPSENVLPGQAANPEGLSPHQLYLQLQEAGSTRSPASWGGSGPLGSYLSGLLELRTSLGDQTQKQQESV